METPQWVPSGPSPTPFNIFAFSHFLSLFIPFSSFHLFPLSQLLFFIIYFLPVSSSPCFSNTSLFLPFSMPPLLQPFLFSIPHLSLLYSSLALSHFSPCCHISVTSSFTFQSHQPCCLFTSVSSPSSCLLSTIPPTSTLSHFPWI